MLFYLSSLRNSCSKLVYFKYFAVYKASHRNNCSVNSFYPVFIPNNTIANCINNYKYLQCLLKRPKVNDFEVLHRRLSTSYRLFNVQKESNDKSPGPGENYSRYIIAALLTTILLTLLFNEKDKSRNFKNISWEEFKYDMLAKGEVKKILIDYKLHIVMIELHEGAIIRNKAVSSKFYFMEVPEVEKFEEKVRKVEEELGISPKDSVPIQYVSENFHSLVSAFTIVLTLMLISSLMVLFGSKSNMKNMPEMFGFSKAKFTLVDPLAGEGKGVKFSDVAGMNEAKTEIIDFVDYLKRPEVYRSLGAKVPKGALLLGPPGCGKTLLAKAVATEANVPFLSMNGSEFIEIIAGLGAARVRDLFKEAKKRSPCIVYIDEIDAIGKKRDSRNSPYGVDEAEQTLNQLLVSMDGVVSNEGVVMLASTNRPDVLDAALLRPGRFDRQILIDLPTLTERQQIFELHLKDIHLEHKPETYSKRMAQLTPGFSGADIANVCNEAALHAARLKKKIVQGSDLEYAIERVVGGTEKRSSALSPEEKKMLAYYEAGRALIGWLSKYGEALLKVTIVSRTDSPAGWSHFAQSDRFLYSKDDLRGKMCMGLGGRVAVTVLFNRVTTAGEKDLKKITKMAYAQVRRFGMSEKVGLMSFDFGEGGNTLKKPYSKALASLFDEEAKLLVRDAYKETEKIILENKDKLIKLAEELLKRETLNYDDIVNVIGPPLFKEKKFIEPLEFALSLDQAAGPEPENIDKSD